MLERKAYKQLLNWKNTHHNNCLMVKGARQVGKTYLIREFGKKEYEFFIEINFIKNPELKTIFSGSLDAENIYKRMSSQIKDLSLVPGKTLIFLDEIQACGNARTSLKFLAEDGKYDIITSGSLLGLAYGEDADINVEEPISIPTGYEDFITMYSLDFEEFLWAEGYKNSISCLLEHFNNKQIVPLELNNKFEELFREYIVVGGMPEVVAEYITNHNFGIVDNMQNKILEDYRQDISKHAKGAKKIKIRSCYDAIPRQLAKELKKFQYSTVEKGQTSKKYGGSIQWLKDSGLVNPCYNVCEPYLPLMANASNEQFKLYLNDIGLLSAFYGFDTKKAILANTIQGNAKCGIYENAISDCLIKKGYKLYYFKPDDNRELEFLIEKNGEVVPVEVKAGNNATKSLNEFILTYSPHVGYKFISGNIGQIDNKVSLPHYMAIFL